MVCPSCNAVLPDRAAACPACGAAVPARQLGAQLDEVRRSLPYGSVHLAAAGFAVAALLLSFTSWGLRPAWWLTILTLLGIGATAAADLRHRGAFAVAAWPLRPPQETALAAATLVLLTATALMSLHLRLGSLMWLLSLAAFVWGALPALLPYADLRPARLLGGYRGLALVGLVVLLAAMTQEFGSASSSLLPSYGYGCDLLGCDFGFGYTHGSVLVAGVQYTGMSIEWAELVVVALVVALGALLAAGTWRPSWLRAVPLAAAAATVLWLVWSLFGSVLVKGGSKDLAWWVAVAALAAFTAGSALLATGQEDGEYAPARLVRRLRGQQPAG